MKADSNLCTKCKKKENRPVPIKQIGRFLARTTLVLNQVNRFIEAVNKLFENLQMF